MDLEMFELYYINIIKPIEKQRNDIRELVYSKKLYHIIFRSTYKKYLKKYDKLLFEEYKKSEMMFLNNSHA